MIVVTILCRIHRRLDLGWGQGERGLNSLHEVRTLCKDVTAGPEATRPPEDLKDACGARGREEPPEAGMDRLANMDC